MPFRCYSHKAATKTQRECSTDQLESFARRSIETDRFLEVLSDHRKYSPAWDPEDAVWARVQCLEANDRYAEAAALLKEELHQSLAEGGWGAIEDAEEFADRVASYPSPANSVADFMRQCIDARRTGSTSVRRPMIDRMSMCFTLAVT